MMDMVDAMTFAYAHLMRLEDGKLNSPKLLGQKTYLCDGQHGFPNGITITIKDSIIVRIEEKNMGSYLEDAKKRNPSIVVDKVGLIQGVPLSDFWVNSAKVTLSSSTERECPPNKVVKYTQLVWKSENSARDNLAVMSVNEYYSMVAPTNRGYLSNNRVSTTIEIWFEDDHHFHVYENDVRVFRSKSAKATAKFLETGEK